jgi:hypothetical protein
MVLPWNSNGSVAKACVSVGIKRAMVFSVTVVSLLTEAVDGDETPDEEGSREKEEDVGEERVHGEKRDDNGIVG